MLAKFFVSGCQGKFHDIGNAQDFFVFQQIFERTTQKGIFAGHFLFERQDKTAQILIGKGGLDKFVFLCIGDNDANP